MTDVPDAYYDELAALVDRYLDAIGRPELHYLNGMAGNEPGEAASNILCLDAAGEFVLTDEQADHLWQLGFAENYSSEQLVPDEILKTAREGRRTRPPEPVPYPLRGGGHAAGRGIPGKTEFPDRWSDDDAMTLVMDVVRSPAGAVKQPDGTFRARGVRDGVDLRVIVTELGHVVTAYPVAGDGVVTNPLDAVRTPYVQRLRHVVESTELDDEAREGMDELMAAGEWDQVVQQLRVLPVPADLADELASLAESAGLG